MDVTADPVESPAPWTPFEDLPPDLRREVLDRIGRSLLVILAGVILFCLIFGVGFAFLVDPRSPRSYEVGAYLLGVFLALSVPIGLSFYLLAIPAGAWPAFLKNERLRDLYGIERAELSNAALRGRMKEAGYLMSSLAGLALSGGSSALVILAWQAASGRPVKAMGMIVVSAVFGNALMTRAWLIRRLVAARQAGRRVAVPSAAPLASGE